jgi:hypothetical protein
MDATSGTPEATADSPSGDIASASASLRAAGGGSLDSQS